jgi:branched-chain amino acid transport system substrate-binding protein
VALAVQQLTKAAGKVALFTAPSTTELTGKQCSPTGIHWVYDSYTNAVGPVSAMIKQGYDSWYFITPDYAAGYSLESNGMAAVKRFGGHILGSVRHPFPSSDMSSFLLTAKASGAKAIMLSNSGSDLIATIKQANEFGLTENGGPALVAPQVFITDINAVGLEMAQGMTFVTAFYWDRDDRSRAFAKRFFARQKKMPTMAQAGAYSAVTHYLRAIQAAGTDDGKTVVDKMKQMPVDDLFGTNGTIRADGRKTHDMLLVKVKKPSESKYPWDYYKILAVIPAKDIFLPLSESECPLVKQQ